ncbi:hypothetical protein QUF61_12250 [Candidatus Venteria ishoeyi]|uniref:hypothetical protein n=1 Tax=Candidatus Venteria ishoeyi TaxID=1899563 RepID=UPI0025A5AD28|nr:hypothetical protein [Candidatus Venteria ishoeyi]MDM8547259.1 hypothetical protein [Candidatus Venteria ishoeyi]
MTELLEELRNNTRLRLGIWLILAILLLYGLLKLGKVQQTLQTEYQQAAQQHIQLQDIHEQTFWLERAKQARALRVEVEDKLWQSASKGLAQADLQAWLNRWIKISKLSKPKLNVESAFVLPEQSNIWQVSAQLNAEFDAKALQLLLNKIAENPQWLVVERLDIQNNQRKPRFKLSVKAFFQASPAS